MDFSPLDSRHWDDPYPIYRELRDQETLHFSPDANAFCVTRHHEAAEVFKQPELFPSRPGFNVLLLQIWQKVGPRDVLEVLRFLVRARVNPLTFRGAPESIISSDPPNHAPLRQIVNRGFTPRRIGAWEKRVRELSEEYVRGLEGAERFDVVEKLAHPLPMTIIAEMLGVDAARIADFRRWSTGLIDALTGSGRRDSPATTLANGGELLRYLRSVIDQRRRDPGDDLISVLIDPTRGEPLDTQAAMLFATVLLIAGNETTTNAMVEESVRLESPFRFMPRQAARDTVIRNTPIAKGSNVMIMIGAANRDERYFKNPDRLDLHRDTSGHLGFGHGIHFCLGASLARLEARVALETLVPLVQDAELCTHGSVRSDSFFTRGFSKLEVSRSAAIAAA
jgi:cytochrome P450